MSPFSSMSIQMGMSLLLASLQGQLRMPCSPAGCIQCWGGRFLLIRDLLRLILLPRTEVGTA